MTDKYLWPYSSILIPQKEFVYAFDKFGMIRCWVFARETYLSRLFSLYMLRQRYARVGAAFVYPICSRVYNPNFDGLQLFWPGMTISK